MRFRRLFINKEIDFEEKHLFSVLDLGPMFCDLGYTANAGLYVSIVVGGD